MKDGIRNPLKVNWGHIKGLNVLPTFLLMKVT